MRGETSLPNLWHDGCDFNPLSPCGERRGAQRHRQTVLQNFNPLSPCGERRLTLLTGSCSGSLFQSTLPMRGETANCPETCTYLLSYFNPLSPCGERQARLACPHPQFQSTLPMRGRDSYREGHVHMIFQSTLPMRGETPVAMQMRIIRQIFQSTLPMRGETERRRA